MYDEELEKAMLYYLIFEQEDYLLDETDFVAERNKKIIRAINELKAEKAAISIFTIKSKIKANGKQVLDYITSLSEYIRTSNVESVYTQLMELSKKRKLLTLMQEKIMDISDCENVDILAQEIVKEVNNIEKINEKEKSFLEQVVETMEQIEKNTLEKTDYSLYTGIQDLDQKTCGLHKQELTIIGARPRSRKNNISVTNCRTYSRKGNRNSNNKFRDVRHTNNSEDVS